MFFPFRFIPLRPDTGFAEKACRLYESAFPECERRPTEAWLALMKNEPAFHAMAIGSECLFVGFLTYWQMSGYVYVEHFAIVPEARGGGIGEHMMVQFLQKHSRLVLEAEPPTDEMVQRRIGFYRRCGLEMSERPYEQPPYHPEAPFVPLVLMSTDLAWLEARFEEVRRAIARKVYGVEIPLGEGM